jgi:hypothetical protein
MNTDPSFWVGKTKYTYKGDDGQNEWYLVERDGRKIMSSRAQLGRFIWDDTYMGSELYSRPVEWRLPC